MNIFMKNYTFLSFIACLVQIGLIAMDKEPQQFVAVESHMQDSVIAENAMCDRKREREEDGDQATAKRCRREISAFSAEQKDTYQEIMEQYDLLKQRFMVFKKSLVFEDSDNGQQNYYEKYVQDWSTNKGTLSLNFDKKLQALAMCQRIIDEFSHWDFPRLINIVETSYSEFVFGDPVTRKTRNKIDRIALAELFLKRRDFLINTVGFFKVTVVKAYFNVILSSSSNWSFFASRYVDRSNFVVEGKNSGEVLLHSIGKEFGSYFLILKCRDIITQLNSDKDFLAHSCKNKAFWPRCSTSFLHEEGFDAGGLTREFISLFFEAFFTPTFFVKADNGVTYIPVTNKIIIDSGFRDAYEKAFEAFGRFLFLVMMNNQPACVPLSPVVFSFLLDQSMMPQCAEEKISYFQERLLARVKTFLNISRARAASEHIDENKFQQDQTGYNFNTLLALLQHYDEGQYNSMCAMIELCEQEKFDDCNAVLECELDEEDFQEVTAENWRDIFTTKLIKPFLHIADVQKHSSIALNAIKRGFFSNEREFAHEENREKITFFKGKLLPDIFDQLNRKQSFLGVEALSKTRSFLEAKDVKPYEVIEPLLALEAFRWLNAYDLAEAMFKPTIDVEDIIKNLLVTDDGLSDDEKRATASYVEILKKYLREKKDDQKALGNFVACITGSRAYSGAALGLSFKSCNNQGQTKAVHTCGQYVDIYLHVTVGDPAEEFLNLPELYKQNFEEFERTVKEMISTWKPASYTVM